MIQKYFLENIFFFSERSSLQTFPQSLINGADPERWQPAGKRNTQKPSHQQVEQTDPCDHRLQHTSWFLLPFWSTVRWRTSTSGKTPGSVFEVCQATCNKQLNSSTASLTHPASFSGFSGKSRVLHKLFYSFHPAVPKDCTIGAWSSSQFVLQHHSLKAVCFKVSSEIPMHQHLDHIKRSYGLGTLTQACLFICCTQHLTHYCKSQKKSSSGHCWPLSP